MGHLQDNSVLQDIYPTQSYTAQILQEMFELSFCCLNGGVLDFAIENIIS